MVVVVVVVVVVLFVIVVGGVDVLLVFCSCSLLCLVVCCCCLLLLLAVCRVSCLLFVLVVDVGFGVCFFCVVVCLVGCCLLVVVVVGGGGGSVVGFLVSWLVVLVGCRCWLIIVLELLMTQAAKAWYCLFVFVACFFSLLVPVYF